MFKSGSSECERPSQTISSAAFAKRQIICRFESPQRAYAVGESHDEAMHHATPITTIQRMRNSRRAQSQTDAWRRSVRTGLASGGMKSQKRGGGAVQHPSTIGKGRKSVNEKSGTKRWMLRIRVQQAESPPGRRASMAGQLGARALGPPQIRGDSASSRPTAAIIACEMNPIGRDLVG